MMKVRFSACAAAAPSNTAKAVTARADRMATLMDWMTRAGSMQENG